MGKKLQRYKMIIDRAASALIIELGFERLNNNIIVERTSLEQEIINKFYKNDDQLRIAGMRYLADIWCNKVRVEAENINDKAERLRYIITEFAFGTDSYTEALSNYIEALYNIIKKTDGSMCFIDELLNIYKMYVDLFISCIASPNINYSSEMHVCAWILVVISDGIHIQSLLKNKLIDKEIAVKILVSTVKSVFTTIESKS